MRTPRSHTIYVTGDAVIDWVLLSGTSRRNDGKITIEYRGAPLLRTLIETSLQKSQASGGSNRVNCEGIDVDIKHRSIPDLEREPQEFAIRGITTSPRQATTWDVYQFDNSKESSIPTTKETDSLNTGTHSCIVIDDADLGFRDQPAAWPRSIKPGASAPRDIILKTSAPVTDSLLLEHLVSHHGSVLTLCCSIDDLRDIYSFIGQPLSWDRTGREIARAVRNNQQLMKAKRVIVRVGLCGAVVVDRRGSGVLLFDPLHQEGEWERLHPGGLDRDTSMCLTAALAVAYAASSSRSDCLDAVRRGIAAGRLAFEHWSSVSRGQILAPDFPTDNMAELIAHAPEKTLLRTVKIPSDREDWHLLSSIFTDGYLDEPKEQKLSRGYGVIASDIVQYGRDHACAGLPVEKMGRWVSLDRYEIESLRSVRNIIQEHIADRARTKPISIAVFGPPGAGKSFAVEEMANHLALGDKKIETLGFNVSQFRNQEDLTRSFQRVRDLTITSGMSLVFWDEFDASVSGEQLAWLSRFLAPMQDGEFSEGGLPRPIGPAIFVFAGGTNKTFEEFREAVEHRRDVKAPDFLSRLRGYVDILGPNKSHSEDEAYVLRRALLFRSMLERKGAGNFLEYSQSIGRSHLNIDSKVLEAFLRVTEYVHGARSMEAIIDMSSLSGKTSFDRSSLPAKEQLSLHVDAEEFLTLSGGLITKRRARWRRRTDSRT